MNSTVYRLYNYKDNIILHAFLGEITQTDNKPDLSKRYVAFYILDKEKQLKERIVFQLSDYSKEIKKLISYNNELYAIKLENIGTEEEKYALYKVELL